MLNDFPTIDSNGDLVRAQCALRLTDEEFHWVAEALADLTEREREVIRVICEGGPNEAMADRMCIAEPTLRTHMMRINQKLGTTDKADVVRLVATRLLDGYRLGKVAFTPARIIEVKPITGVSTGRRTPDPDRKSSLAMTTSESFNGQ